MNRTRVVTFKIDEELLTELDLYCINNKLDRSQVIRDAIKFYLKFYLLYKKGRVYRLNSVEENLRNKTVVREL
jgi:metal-responsive CopG/Arc/MetJ family transcriptional regulator